MPLLPGSNRPGVKGAGQMAVLAVACAVVLVLIIGIASLLG